MVDGQPNAAPANDAASPTLPCGATAPPCCPVKLRVGCGHRGRGFVLDVPGAPTKDGRQVLQILADELVRADTGEPMSMNSSETAAALRDLIRVDLITTSCHQGFPSAVGPGQWSIVPNSAQKDVRPRVTIEGGAVGAGYPAPYAVTALSTDLPPLLGEPGEDPLIGFNDFLLHFLLPAAPVVYTIGVVACNGTEQLVADVEVFPVQSWSGELSFAYAAKTEHETREFKSSRASGDPNRRKKGYATQIDTKTWSASSTVTVKYGDRTISVAFPVEELNYVRKVSTFLGKVKDLEALSGKANKLVGVASKFSVKYPVVKLSGKLERQENAGKWSVGITGSVKLALDPLIGLDVEVDILDALVAAAGTATGTVALAKVILIAKEAARENRVCEIALRLQGTSKIFAELNWVGSDTLAPASAKGGGAIGLKIEGLVAAANEFWNVAAGANMGGETKFSFGCNFAKGKQPALSPFLEWSGITVFYSTFIGRTKGAEVGAASRSIKDQVKAKDATVKHDRTIQLIQAWSDPPKTGFGPPPASSTGLGDFLS